MIILLKKISLLKNYEKVMILIGLLGIIPFIFGFFDLWLNKKNLYFSINIPKFYGIIILTFLGAGYWGISLNFLDKENISNRIKTLIIIWSVVPSILSLGVLLIDYEYSLIILSCGFLICIIADEILKKALLFPDWYIILRRLLSFIVITTLIGSQLIIIF